MTFYVNFTNFFSQRMNVKVCRDVINKKVSLINWGHHPWQNLGGKLKKGTVGKVECGRGICR